MTCLDFSVTAELTFAGCPYIALCDVRVGCLFHLDLKWVEIYKRFAPSRECPQMRDEAAYLWAPGTQLKLTTSASA